MCLRKLDERQSFVYAHAAMNMQVIGRIYYVVAAVFRENFEMKDRARAMHYTVAQKSIRTVY